MKNIWSQVSWLRTLLVGAAAIIVGGVLLLSAEALHGKWYAQLLYELGSVLIATVALIVIFDFWQKDAPFRELFKNARSARFELPTVAEPVILSGPQWRTSRRWHPAHR